MRKVWMIAACALALVACGAGQPDAEALDTDTSATDAAAPTQVTEEPTRELPARLQRQEDSSPAPSSPAIPVDVDPAADPDNWRAVDPERVLKFTVPHGDVFIELAPEYAPKHAARLTQLVEDGFYDNTPFHRVLDEFMAQGGDPTGTGTGGSGQNIEAEFERTLENAPEILETKDHLTGRQGYWNGFPVGISEKPAMRMMMEPSAVATWIMHCPGVTSMARANPPNSADSQFFWVRADSLFLDRQYTAWGRVIDGLSVVRTIKLNDPGSPTMSPDRIVNAVRLSSIDAAERPQFYVMRPEGPLFQAYLQEQTAAQGRVPSVCSIYVPSVTVMP